MVVTATFLFMMCLGFSIVSRVCIPHFATLVLVESVWGAYMWDLTFYLMNMNTPPLPGSCIDVNIYYIPLQKLVWHHLPSLLLSSRNCMVKFDWQRLATV